MVAKEATKEGLWLRSIFQEMGVPQAKPMRSFGVSQSCTPMTKNAKFHECFRHIEAWFDYTEGLEFVKCEYIA